jgi:hypothetical protein
VAFVPKTQLTKLRPTEPLPTVPRIDLPRPALIAAVGLLVLAITFFVTKPGDNTGSVATPARSAPAKTKSAEAKTTAAAAKTKSAAAKTTKSATASAAAKPTRPAEPAVAPGPGLPTGVARALNAQKVVVLFFYEPAAADDQATKRAVHAVRSAARPAARGRVTLFQDKVVRISDYRRLVGSLGISQSPAMVVIDRSRNAQLLQGYLDAGTIKQTVRDAL